MIVPVDVQENTTVEPFFAFHCRSIPDVSQSFSKHVNISGRGSRDGSTDGGCYRAVPNRTVRYWTVRCSRPKGERCQYDPVDNRATR